MIRPAWRLPGLTVRLPPGPTTPVAGGVPPFTELPAPQFVALVAEYFARNGLVAHGPYMRAIARALNHLVARCGFQAPAKVILPASARNTATELRLWTRVVRCGPNGTRLINRVRCIKTDDTAQAPFWYVNVDGVKATNAVTGVADNQTHANYSGTGVGNTLDDVFEMTEEIVVTPDTKHTLDLYTSGKCRVVSWDTYEKPRESLVVGTDTVVDYSNFQSRRSILDADLANVYAVANAIYNKLRGIPLEHHVDDPATPIAVSTTAATPVWAAGGVVGARVPTRYRNTYSDQFAATPAIPCYLWVRGERTAGAGDVWFRLKGANHPLGVDVKINGAVQIWESTDFTLRPGPDGDTLIAEHFVSVGGTTGNIYDFGLFPLIGA